MKTSSSLSRLVASFAVVLSLCPLANAQTVIIFPPVTLVDGSTPGYYNNALGTILDGTAPQFPLPLGSGGSDPLINPSAEPNLAAATNVLGNWLTPYSTLNANWLQLPTIPATWADNTETAIIYEINGGTHGITNLVGNFDADNGLFVWVNGQYKFGARGPGLPSPAGQFEYTNVFLGNILPGTNRIQILREDNFAATGYQVRIAGNPLGGDLPPQPCVSAPSGLISWWRAESNTVDMISGNSGTLQSGATFATGEVGQSFTFNGTNSYVEVHDFPSLRLTNALTIEFWVKRQRFDNSVEYCVEKGGDWTDGQQNYGVALSRQSINYAMTFHFAGGWRGAGSVADTNWHHCAVVARNGDADPTFYIDGVLQPVLYREGAGAINLYPSTRPLHIGAQVDPVSGWMYFGKVLLDEISIYSRILSASEIQSIYAVGSAGKCAGTNPPVVNCTLAPTGLVSWWPGNQTPFDVVSGNNGTLGGNATYATGLVGSGFEFDGNTDGVNLGNPANLRLQNFTIEAWIKRGSTTICSLDQIQGPGGVMLSYGFGGYGFGVFDSGELFLSEIGLTYVGSPLFVTDTNYHHVAVTKSGGNVTFYLDGVAAPVANYNPTFQFVTEATIGAVSADRRNNFLGRVDELAVYNRALTTAEIQAIATIGSGGKCTTNPPLVNCASAPSGLLSWWRAENGALDSAGANHGTLAGNAIYGPGKVGQGLFFDGNADVVSVGNAPALQLQDFSIETWVRRTSTAQVSFGSYGNGVIFGFGQNGYGLYLDPNGVPALSKIGINETKPAVAITDTNFHHLAVTKSGSTVIFYFDGVAYSSPAYDPGFTFTSVAAIGARGDNLDNSFLGVIDEVCVYNRPLSATEVQSIYNAGSNGKCTTNPPVVNCTTAPSAAFAWWQAETNTYNSVGGGAGNFASPSYNAGKVGTAFDFNGANNVVIPDQPTFNPTNALTIECWVYPRALTTSYAQDLVSKDGEFSGPRQYMLTMGPPPGLNNGTGGFRAHVGVPGGFFYIDGATQALLNTWYHVAMTYDGATLKLFVNGSLDAQLAVTGPIITSAEPIRLGGGAPASDPAYFFDGRLDEVTLYSRALSQTEIQSIYTAGSAGKCPPPQPPQPPSITQHPQDRTVNANATARFAVTATGAPTLRYQWFFAGNPLPGATNSVFSISNSVPINQGNYFVTVSNDFGFAVSSNASLTVLTFPPVITRQPTNLTVIVSSSATLSVQATGSVTLAYQWLSNGIPMAGRTSTSLAFQSAQFSNAANYSVIVTNPYGAVTSSVATLTVNPIPPCVAVHDGLVSWWKGENNAIDSWDSNNGAGVVTRFLSGKVGLAFAFPPISVNDSPSLRVTNGLTLETWINPSSISSVRVLVSKFEYPLNQPQGTQSAYLLGTTNNGALFFTLTPNGSVRTNTTLLTTNLIPLNKWTHVAATYDGSVMRLYINGSQIGQTNYTGRIFPGSAPLGIGGFAGSSFTTSSPWQYSGLIDEVSIYNRALSAAEIQSIVGADLTGKCLAPPVVTKQPQDQIVPLGEDVKFSVGVSGSRPLAYQWYFNSKGTQFPNEKIIGATNASLIIEKVRTNNFGTYFVAITNTLGFATSGAVRLSTLPAPSCVDVLPGLISWWPGDTNTLDAMGRNNIAQYSPPSYPTGKVASAFTFNGTQSRITINNSASLNFTNNQNFSIEMWIKAVNTNSTYPNVPLLEKFDEFRGYSLSLYNGRPAFALGGQTASGATSSRLFVSAGADLRDAFFHHVAVTINRTNSSGGVLYVDGIPVLVFDPRTYTNSLLNQVPLYIGGPFSTRTNSYFNGLIDEPAIYSRALTPQEILSIRAAGAAGRCKARPTIVVQPVDVAVLPGSNTTLTVQAIGTPLLRYQWRWNNQSLFAATNASLTITNVTSLNTGSYSVIVSNIFGSATSSNAVVTVSNRPPVALPSSVFVNEDSIIGITPNGSDPDRNPLTYIIVSQPTNGTLVKISAFPIYQYRPNPNYFGPDAFVFKVNDGFSDSTNAVVSINVLPINDPPVAFSEQFDMDEDTALPIQLRADDVDDTDLTFSILQQPTHGVLSGSGSKRIYTPGTNYFGDDYFTFIARDGSNAASQMAVISITIRPVNDAPVARIVVTPLDQLPGETNTVLISPACCDTTLVLDGSQSSDVENAPLIYIWMDGTNVIATTAILTNQFSPSLHEFTLIVSDGELTGTETLIVEILKTEEAVLHLQSLVQTAVLARNEKAALINWLSVTIKALEHCNVDQAVMFLERFEARVAERISVINAKDAERWITTSQAIREVAGLCDPAHRPGGGNGNQNSPKSKSEQEGGSAGRGNPDEVRAGKSSLR